MQRIGDDNSSGLVHDASDYVALEHPPTLLAHGASIVLRDIAASFRVSDNLGMALEVESGLHHANPSPGNGEQVQLHATGLALDVETGLHLADQSSGAGQQMRIDALALSLEVEPSFHLHVAHQSPGDREQVRLDALGTALEVDPSLRLHHAHQSPGGREQVRDDATRLVVEPNLHHHAHQSPGGDQLVRVDALGAALDVEPNLHLHHAHQSPGDREQVRLDATGLEVEPCLHLHLAEQSPGGRERVRVDATGLEVEPCLHLHLAHQSPGGREQVRVDALGTALDVEPNLHLHPAQLLEDALQRPYQHKRSHEPIYIDLVDDSDDDQTMEDGHQTPPRSKRFRQGSASLLNGGSDRPLDIPPSVHSDDDADDFDFGHPVDEDGLDQWLEPGLQRPLLVGASDDEQPLEAVQQEIPLQPAQASPFSAPVNLLAEAEDLHAVADLQEPVNTSACEPIQRRPGIEFLPMLDDATKYDIDYFRVTAKPADLLTICATDWEIGSRERRVGDRSSESKYLRDFILILQRPNFVYIPREYADDFLSKLIASKKQIFLPPPTVAGRAAPKHLIHSGTSKFVSAVDCVRILESLSAEMKVVVISYGAKSGLQSYDWLWDIAARQTVEEDFPVVDVGVNFAMGGLPVFCIQKHALVASYDAFGPYASYKSKVWNNFTDYCRSIRELVAPHFDIGGGISMEKNAAFCPSMYKAKLYPRIVHYWKNTNKRRIGDMPHPSTNQKCQTRYKELVEICDAVARMDETNNSTQFLTGFRVELTVGSQTLDGCVAKFREEFERLFQFVTVLEYPTSTYLANIRKFSSAMVAVGPAHGRSIDLADDKFKIPLVFVAQELGMTSHLCSNYLRSRLSFIDDKWSWVPREVQDDQVPSIQEGGQHDLAVEDVGQLDLPIDDALDADLANFRSRFSDDTLKVIGDVFINLKTKLVKKKDATRLYRSYNLGTGRFDESRPSKQELCVDIATKHQLAWRQAFVKRQRGFIHSPTDDEITQALKNMLVGDRGDNPHEGPQNPPDNVMVETSNDNGREDLLLNNAALNIPRRRSPSPMREINQVQPRGSILNGYRSANASAAEIPPPRSERRRLDVRPTPRVLAWSIASKATYTRVPVQQSIASFLESTERSSPTAVSRILQNADDSDATRAILATEREIDWSMVDEDPPRHGSTGHPQPSQMPQFVDDAWDSDGDSDRPTHTGGQAPPRAESATVAPSVSSLSTAASTFPTSPLHPVQQHDESIELAKILKHVRMRSYPQVYRAQKLKGQPFRTAHTKQALAEAILRSKIDWRRELILNVAGSANLT